MSRDIMALGDRGSMAQLEKLAENNHKYDLFQTKEYQELIFRGSA